MFNVFSSSFDSGPEYAPSSMSPFNAPVPESSDSKSELAPDVVSDSYVNSSSSLTTVSTSFSKAFPSSSLLWISFCDSEACVRVLKPFSFTLPAGETSLDRAVSWLKKLRLSKGLTSSGVVSGALAMTSIIRSIASLRFAAAFSCSWWRLFCSAAISFLSGMAISRFSLSLSSLSFSLSRALLLFSGEAFLCAASSFAVTSFLSWSNLISSSAFSESNFCKSVVSRSYLKMRFIFSPLNSLFSFSVLLERMSPNSSFISW